MVLCIYGTSKTNDRVADVYKRQVHDYKRLLHRVYVKGEHNPKAWYDLVELERFFCSRRFSQFTSLDGRALIERIRGEMNL